MESKSLNKHPKHDNTETGGSSPPAKHISFVRSGPKVNMVQAPRKAEHPDLWFTETETVVTKPLSFTIDANSKVNIDIDLSVQLLSMVAVVDPEVEGEENSKSLPPHSSSARVALMVCSNEAGFPDSLDERLEAVLGGKGLHNGEKKKKGAPEPKMFYLGSTTLGRMVKIRVKLPRGAYLLKAEGPYALEVFGHAADVERKLM
jgi:hypothetical protein